MMVNLHCKLIKYTDNYFLGIVSSTDPFLRLSPLPFTEDFSFGLSESEGLSDLFDITVPNE